MSLIQDDCSDAALRDIISDDLVPERKKAVAREMLRRRRHGAREAWLARHGFVAALIGAIAGLAAFFVGRSRKQGA
jgi:hypothetical protein